MLNLPIRFINFPLVVLTLLWVGNLFSSTDSQLEQLLESPHRPTVQQVREALVPWPEQTPIHQYILKQIDTVRNRISRNANNLVSDLQELSEFQNLLRLLQRTEAFIGDLKEYGPYMIASLERVYPGAVWAMLGRDVAAVADILESFYLSIGQADRIQRIDASRATINDADSDTLVKLLTSNGLDLEKIAEGRPYILIDRTGYSETSQTRKLVSAVYEQYVKQNRNQLDLLMKFGALSTSQQPDTSDKITLVRNHFYNQFVRVSGYGSPDEALGVVNANLYSDRAVWHDSFGRAVKRNDGTFGGTLGDPASTIARLIVIHEIYSLYEVVTSPKFLRDVKKYLRQFKSQLVLKSSDPFNLKMAPKLNPDQREAFVHSLQQLKPNERPNFMTFLEYFTSNIRYHQQTNYKPVVDMLALAAEIGRLSRAELKGIIQYPANHGWPTDGFYGRLTRSKPLVKLFPKLKAYITKIEKQPESVCREKLANS